MTGPDAPLVRLVARGHPAIRATHDATIEVTADAVISERATCVIGVEAKVVEGSERGVAGPVAIELEAAGRHEVVQAVGVSTFDGIGGPERPAGHDGGIVVRASGSRLPDTLAVEADAVAAGLDRAFVDALRDPATVLRVTVRARPRRADARPQLMVAADDRSGSAWLRGERRAAQVVGSPTGTSAGRFVAEAVSTWRSGGRVLALLDGSQAVLPPALIEALPPDAVVQSAGVPAAWAALALLGGDAPAHITDRPRRAADVAAVADLVRHGHRVVLPVRSRDLVRFAGQGLPADLPVVLVDDPGGPRQGYRRGRIDDLVAWGPSVGDGTVVAVGGRVEATARSTAGPAAPADLGLFVDGLLGAGVPAGAVAAALGPVPGWSRNTAYRFVTDRAGALEVDRGDVERRQPQPREPQPGEAQGDAPG